MEVTSCVHQPKVDCVEGFVCLECGSSEFIRDPRTGDTICSFCGLVFSEHNIDPSHPTISVDCLNELKTSGYKKFIPYNRLQRALKRDKQLKWSERSKIISSVEIKRLSENLNIPPYVVESAKEIYNKARKAKLVVGRTIQGISVAALYYSCKLYLIPRSIQEMSSISEISCLELKKCYRKIVTGLKLKVPTMTAINYIPKYANELNLGQETQNKATEIINIYSQNYNNSGKTPKGIVGAALYLACFLTDYKVSQKKIAQHLQISDVTLRTRYKELLKIYNRSASIKKREKKSIAI